MRSRHRLDANHGAILQACEAMGWFVEDCSQTNLGYDAIITKAGRTERLEIKDPDKPPSARKLTPNEAKKHAALKAHGVHVHLVLTVEDLVSLDRHARERYEGVPARDFYREV